MVDKINKIIATLSPKERAWVTESIEKLLAHTTDGLNIKKLKGHADIFRIRKGDIRILYKKEKEHIFILAIERRKEDTYKLR